MATIAKVTMQDGQAAVGAATEGAGGEAGAEFTALLSEATATTPSPAGTTATAVPEAPRAGDELAQTAEVAVAAAGTAVALPAPADLRMPAPRDGEPLPATGRMNPRGPLRLEWPPVLPGPVVPPAAEAVATPAASASPVAAAVLHALHSGQPPAVPAGAAPAGGLAAAGPAPIAEAIARLADAVHEVAGLESGAEAGSEGDGAPAGAPGQPSSGGPLLRDVVAGALHPRTLAGTVGTPPWRDSLGTELRLMIERGVGAATLRLSPEHLGPLEVRIDFTDDGANVWFTASHADTRAALAEALPRLRDMLASVGVNLGEAGVQRDLPGEPGRRDGSWRDAGPDGTEGAADARTVVARLDAGRGMVDEYA